MIVTDYNELVAVDMKTGENKVFPIRDIDKLHLLPAVGRDAEKARRVHLESHADVQRRTDGQTIR